MQQEPTMPETNLATVDTQIAWVLAHPGMSDWLKDTLRSALLLNPITVVNDLEVLRRLLIPRATTLTGIALGNFGDARAC